MEIPFTKLHGNGNDFVLIDEYEKTAIPDEMKAQFAALYCDRRFGIGADGVLYLSKSTTCNIRMRIFQPDESEAEMCGNGVRCLAKYASDARVCGRNLYGRNRPGQSGFRPGILTRSLLRPSACPSRNLRKRRSLPPGMVNTTSESGSSRSTR